MEPMNEISNSKRRKVVLLWASQLGKSEMINNTLGYYIHQEPSTESNALNSSEIYSLQKTTTPTRKTKY
ncbi:phage terminase large subunit family protein [Campylobacter ureolyticus]|uniref:Phage terminase large subunit family protein n=2 Tax=Campylobacter ureolyticus TaxID=827 RepID=A0A9Q4PXA8_9BACT|nr:phage terminase large subunit family protein [Campylobacter ureolyticus]MCZ6104052.1 phage terminase large subunit family protein [Campylobacter ureolyticus]MCZ6135475.1 phage terminase large subunit family protein [Campylobacter ureolyticus]MCZ6162431.1 phage terminase large subunit family protein [Campylobacter ureolyticus]MCZ6171356.1 phage terminase large subunit family protein [Campylobacter ureolyticus]